MLFAVVHAAVGDFDDFFGVFVYGFVLFKSDRDRDEDLFIEENRGRGGNVFAERIDFFAGFGQGKAAKENDEFFSTPAADVAARELFADHESRMFQDLVATIVAIGIVDSFEVVQIAKSNAEAAGVLVFHEVFDHGQKASAVQKIGQRVSLSIGVQLAVLLLQIDYFVFTGVNIDYVIEDRRKYHSEHGEND